MYLTTEFFLSSLVVILALELFFSNMSVFVVAGKKSGFSKMDVIIIGELDETTRQTARSKIECANRCSAEPSCRAFTFDRSNKQCTTSPGLINASGGLYSSVKYHCPANEGYILSIYPDMELCLKYNSNRVEHSIAKQNCEADGGHLMMIESGAMRLRVNTSLHKMGVTGYVYYDGHKFPNDSVIDFNGKPLPWVEWGSTNPGADSEICIAGRADEGFLLRDTQCHVEFSFVCQLDIRV